MPRPTTPSQEILTQLYETMTDGVVCYGDDGKILFCNPGMCVITGRSFEEILGRTSEEAWGIPINFPDSIHASAITEQAIRRPNGMLRYLSVKTFPLAGTDGLKVAIYRDETRSRNAMESMRRAEERLHDILNVLPIILWTADLNLVITSTLGSGLDLLDIRPNAHQGQGLSRLFPSDDPEPEITRATRRALHGKPQRLRHSMNGRHFDGQISPLRQISGEVAGTVGILIDVTELVNVRDAYETTSKEYKVLFNEAPIGNFVFSPTGRLLNCNDQFLRTLGFATHDDARRSVNLAQWTNEIGESCLYLLKGQTSLNTTIQARRANGALVHLKISIQGRFDDEGELIVSQGSITDLTVGRKLERALGRTEAHLQGVLSLCSVAVIHFNADGVVLDIRADGLPRHAPDLQDLHGKRLLSHLSSSDAGLLEAAMVNCREGSQSEDLHICLKCHGQNLPLQARLSLIANGQFVMILRDPVGHDLVEGGVASLPPSGDSFSGLLGPIAHEINNYLMGILGHAGLAMMDGGPGHSSHDSLRMIEKTTLEASQFTSNLLSGSWRTTRAGMLSLQDLLGELTRTIVPQLSPKTRFRSEVIGPLPPIRGVHDQLLLLLTNLVKVAAARLRGEGEINIEVTSENLNASDLSDCLGDSSPQGGTFVRLRIAVEAFEGGEDRLNLPGSSSDFEESRALATCLGILRAHKSYVRLKHPRDGSLHYEVMFPA
ncbi:MAG: PAS domain-containing sensor histidine kinase, partial [Candidatus Sumerlaeia bacterium]|nr:PAS domain-containing sensor histidine kinase [Candidatus Sumerlaeia bacterium]